MTSRITVLDGSTDVAARAAEITIEVLQAAIAQKGRAVWALAGGTSPIFAYQFIQRHMADSLDWTKVLVVIGDERFVPIEHPDSNWGVIQPLVEKLGVVVCMPQILTNVEATATAYNELLRENGVDEFDLAWVGVGEDGHTLSLFPGNDGFTNDVSGQYIIPVHHSPKPPADRVTLSMTAVQNIKSLTIFATGEAKRSALQRVRGGESLPIGVVANAVIATGGVVEWLYDQQAFGHDKQSE